MKNIDFLNWRRSLVVLLYQKMEICLQIFLNILKIWLNHETLEGGACFQDKITMIMRLTRRNYLTAGLNSVHTIPIGDFALSSTDRLVPKDFSHSGRSSFEELPDIANLFYFLRSSIATMTKVLFGFLRHVTDSSGIDIATTPMISTSYTYTGREREPELDGIYFYRARMYDSSNGRFMQKDPDPSLLLV